MHFYFILEKMRCLKNVFLFITFLALLKNGLSTSGFETDDRIFELTLTVELRDHIPFNFNNIGGDNQEQREADLKRVNGSQSVSHMSALPSIWVTAEQGGNTDLVDIDLEQTFEDTGAAQEQNNDPSIESENVGLGSKRPIPARGKTNLRSCCGIFNSTEPNSTNIHITTTPQDVKRPDLQIPATLQDVESHQDTLLRGRGNLRICRIL
jgi:hypothetical protein